MPCGRLRVPCDERSRLCAVKAVEVDVVIAEAGSAWLILSELLSAHGIDSVIVERRSRNHVE